MDLDLINKNHTTDLEMADKSESGVVVRRRKRRTSENTRSIFDMYKSEKTIKDYRFYLKDFLLFLFEEDYPLDSANAVTAMMLEVTQDDVADYLSHLLYERNLKKTSVNKIISALKSLYRELEKRLDSLEIPMERKFKNPFKNVSLFKTSRNLDNILKVSFEDIKNILDNYKVYGEKEYRNTVILYTLFYTGMRSSELINVRYNNILKRDDSYFIKLEKTKSGREQYKPMHDILVKKIAEYKNFIMNMYNLSEEELEERFVFPSSFQKNSQLTYKALYKIIQDMGKTIGMDISPHNIRHAIATELSTNGANILEIRDFLGHADTRVTEIYINAKSLLDKKVISKIPEYLQESEK